MKEKEDSEPFVLEVVTEAQLPVKVRERRRRRGAAYARGKGNGEGERFVLPDV